MKSSLPAFVLFLSLASACTSTPATRQVASKCPQCEEALSREERGFRNDAYEAVILRMRANHEKPDSDADYKIHPYQLLSAVRTVVARDTSLAVPHLGDALVKNNRGQRMPLEVFFSLRRQLKKVFWKRFELSEEEGDAFAENIERDALDASFITEKVFTEATGKKFRTTEDMTRLVKSGSDKLWRTSTIEKNYDVPYIAGYAPDDPKFIFIDRMVPEFGKANGKKIPAHYLLNVHERVEKILLDEMGLIYQHAHQIAQRSERRAAAGLGITWKEYDGWTQKLDVSAKRPLKVHPNLDMTCYYSYEDEDNLKLVAEMEESKRNFRR